MSEQHTAATTRPYIVCDALDEYSDNADIVISLPVSQDGAGS